MKYSRTLAFITVAVSCLVSLATFLAPTPPDQSALGFHAQFLETIITAGLFVGATTILLLGLKAFTTKFKLAYATVCIGYTLLSVSFLQIPLLTFVSPRIADLAWVASGGVILPFIASVWLLYFGTRGFARLFGVRSIWTRPWLVLIVSIIFAAIAVVLPHAPWHGQTEQGFDGTVGGVVLTVVPVIFAGYVARLARLRANTMYASLLNGFAAALLCSSLCSLSELFAAYFITNGIEIVASGIMFIPLIVGGALMLRTAVQFNSRMVNEQAAIPHTSDGTADSRLAIDAVVCVAKLVSSPQAIDPTLDEMRQITVNVKPNEPLSSSQEATLWSVYQKIEQYIATQEPVRRRTPPEIRQIVQRTLPSSLQANRFWQQLTRPGAPPQIQQ